MQSHINNVVSFMQQAGQNVPDTLCVPSESERLLRAKLILEEAFELIQKGLGIEVLITSDQTESIVLNSEEFSYQIVKDADPIESLDGAADLLWVGVTGVALIFGADLESVVEEVDSSNLSKFIDGYRRDDGKWQKGPSYRPADIGKALKNRKGSIGEGYYAFPVAGNIDSFYIVKQSFWDENGYVDDYCEIANNIPGFHECMESCVSTTNENMSNIEAENLLASLGFTILDVQN